MTFSVILWAHQGFSTLPQNQGAHAADTWPCRQICAKAIRNVRLRASKAPKIARPGMERRRRHIPRSNQRRLHDGNTGCQPKYVSLLSRCPISESWASLGVHRRIAITMWPGFPTTRQFHQQSRTPVWRPLTAGPKFQADEIAARVL